MSGQGNGDVRAVATADEPPPGSFEARLLQDETRLMRDELRLARDEARIARDEARITATEQANKSNRMLGLVLAGLGGVLIVALAALVIALVAVRRDVNSIEQSTPGNSVSTASIQDGAVTANKLALGSVTTGALADGSIVRSAIGAGAIGSTQIAPNAVTGGAVRANSLTGSDISEKTLATVPSASRAASAANATKLGTQPASAYVRSVLTQRAYSSLNANTTKGPLAAHCPNGMRAISGGAAIGGSTKGVSIVRSEPRGGVWLALATASGKNSAWQLVVTAVCARGGS